MCSFINYHAIIFGLTLRLPRLYAILDTGCLDRRGMDLEAAARVMLEAGVRLLQLRHKTHFTRRLFEVATQIRQMCRRYQAQFVVNDRADIACLLDAGLHVGQDDLPPTQARRLIGAERLLGLSTHNPDQFTAALAEPVDYVAFGPVFPTATKENPDPVTGLALLPALSTQAHRTGRPLVAIGGITRAKARAVLEAGADAVAVISDLLPEPCTADSLRERVEEWLRVLEPTRS